MKTDLFSGLFAKRPGRFILCILLFFIIFFCKTLDNTALYVRWIIMTFILKSGREQLLVSINKRDYGRMFEYSPTWYPVRKNGKIIAIVTTVYVQSQPGSSRGFKTRQVKLAEFILGDIPKCKGIHFRDGDPLNNRRENLVLYQAYHTERIKNALSKRKRTSICQKCRASYRCREVAIRRKVRGN